MVKACLEFDLKSILADDNGRYILMNATVQGWNYFLAIFMRRTKYAKTSPRMLLSFATCTCNGSVYILAGVSKSLNHSAERSPTGKFAEVEECF